MSPEHFEKLIADWRSRPTEMDGTSKNRIIQELLISRDASANAVNELNLAIYSPEATAALSQCFGDGSLRQKLALICGQWLAALDLRLDRPNGPLC